MYLTVIIDRNGIRLTKMSILLTIMFYIIDKGELW